MQKASDGWLALTDSQCHDPYGLAMKISGVNHGGGPQYDGVVLGTMLYRDGEYLNFIEKGEDLNGNYIDENDDSQSHLYELRVVYDGDALATPSLGTYYAMSCPFAIESELSIEETTPNSVSIYPNPSNGHFTIEAEGMKHIDIFNALGQCVKSENIDNEIHEVYLGSSYAGIYLIQVLTETGMISKTICIQ